MEIVCGPQSSTCLLSDLQQESLLTPVTDQCAFLIRKVFLTMNPLYTHIHAFAQIHMFISCICLILYHIFVCYKSFNSKIERDKNRCKSLNVFSYLCKPLYMPLKGCILCSGLVTPEYLFISSCVRNMLAFIKNTIARPQPQSY